MKNERLARKLGPRREELNELRRRLEPVLEMPKRRPGKFFLCVTPYGCAQKARFLQLLRDAKISILPETRLLPDWGDLSAFLYSDSLSDYVIEKAWAYRLLWREFHPGAHAEQWMLKSRKDYVHIRRIKYELRSKLNSFALPVELPAFARDLHFHAFHLPDEERMTLEGAILDRLVEGAQPERRKPRPEQPRGKRFSVYLPAHVVEGIDDFRARTAFKPAVSRIIAVALEKLLASEERRKSGNRARECR